MKYLFFFFIALSISKFDAQNDIQLIQKAKSFVKQMTLEEKVAQTCQVTLDALLKTDEKGIVIEPITMDENKVQQLIVEQKIGSVLNVSSHTLQLEEWSKIIQSIHKAYKNGKTKIPVLYGVDAIHGANYVVGGTLFPQEIGLAATWNPNLAYKMGEITAYETRTSGVPWNFSPVLDLGRQPLWSRFFETLGEDPYLASEMGVQLVSGYQGNDPSGRTKVAACMKHFVGYSLPRSGRDRTPSWIPERIMKELYFPSFKAAVDAGALTVMINSGDVNGVPGHINKTLITDILKKEWGFKGFAVSDWEDIRMLHTVHKVASSQKEAIIMAINAGLDMSMVPYNGPHEEYMRLFKEAVMEKKISLERLNDAATRILYVKLKLGIFENPYFPVKDYTQFGSAEFKMEAKKAALESITLLKNKNAVLPLQSNEKILLVGEAANNLIFQNGAWTHTWQGVDTNFNTTGVPTLHQALNNRLGSKLIYKQGYDLSLEGNWESNVLLDLPSVIAAAKNVDKIIVCLGEMPGTEKTGDSRSLHIDAAQTELVKALHAISKPIITILFFGKPRIVREIESNSDAVVMAYLPGDWGGEALAEILVGYVNPSGKLPFTYPRYDGVIEYYDYVNSETKTNKTSGEVIDPQWPFGFGLSYTNFEYSNLVLSKNKMHLTDSITATVTLKNTGKLKGKEVIEWFLTDEYASITPANKKLKGFSKVELQPGESINVSFVIRPEALSFYDANAKKVIEKGAFTLQVGGLKQTFTLE